MEDERSNYEAAFSELYDAYFERIYDFSIRLAQDRDIAALAVQSTFLRALRAIRAGQDAGHLPLYVGAHHDTAERMRARRGEAEQFDEPYGAIDASLLSIAVDDVPEFGRMVWSAALELKVNDYELLDLSVRQRLTAEDMAVVLQARSEAVERKLATAMDQLAQAMRARLLFTRGRRDCLDLDFQLGETEWSDSLQRRILRHSDTCQVCRASLSANPAASDLLAALLPVPAPAGWKDTILERLQEAVQNEPASDLPPAAKAQAAVGAAEVLTSESTPSAAASEPVPRPEKAASLPEYGDRGGGGSSLSDGVGALFGGGGPRGPLLGALLGGLIAVVIVIASLCATGTFDGGDDDEPGPTATVSVTPTAEASGTPTVTPTPTMTATLEPLPQPTEPLEPTATDALPEPTDIVPDATPTSPAPTEPAATEPAPTVPPPTDPPAPTAPPDPPAAP